jgi:hypothetical protein
MRFAAVLLLAVIDVFAAGAKAQPAAGSAPKLLLETPECAVTVNGRVDCLARDASGAFIWTYHDGRRWSRPQRFAGQFAGPASCVVRGPLGLNCFAIRADGTLWQAAMNGGVWRPWRPLGGRLALGRPFCVAPGRNQIVCHARSANGTLAIKSWLGDTTWQEWRDAGGALSSDPSCVRLGFDRVACFWRRADGMFSGLYPAEIGPGAAILTLPRRISPPACAALGGQRAFCLGAAGGGKTLEWRGQAILGGAGVDDFSTRDIPIAGPISCSTRSGRAFCALMTQSGTLSVIEATGQGWSSAVELAAPGVAHSGRCFVFDQLRLACTILTASGELRTVFRELNAAPGSGPGIAQSGPLLVEKPAPPSTPTATLPPAASASAPPAISTVSANEPLGVWRIFEPRTGLHCGVTLFDAPAQPYRSLTRDADCAAMESLRGVDRWSQTSGGIFLRDRRGRVMFRFFEAGPTALRAQWRRSDFIMLARDLRAFAAPPVPSEVKAEAAGANPGMAGTWRLRGPGRQSCRIHLRVDAETAATRAAPEGCSGALAQADGWSVRRGALVLERNGAPLARFVEGRGVTWFGRFEGGRGGLRMVKQ